MKGICHMKSMLRYTLLLLVPFALLAAACGSDEAESSTDDAPEASGAEADAGDDAMEDDAMEDDAMEDDAMEDDDHSGDDAMEDGDGPATMPASITADAQDSDGTTVVVASITLPAPGFIAVHGDGGGSPGPVIGHSDLLPEGESTEVSITLDTPLAETGDVYPMAHIDINDNGVYEFNPPEETVDAPALTEAGDVAVVPATVTVG